MLILAFIGGMFILVGSLVSVGLCADLLSDIALTLASTQTSGVITSVTPITNVEINGENPDKIDFTYRVDGREMKATSTSVPPATPSPGESVRVEYSSRSPEVARIVGTTRVAGGLVMGFPILFPVLGSIFVIVALRKYWRRRQVFVHGTPIVGVISSYGPDRNVQVNGVHPMKLTWMFEDPHGRRCTGSLRTMDVAQLGEYALGAHVIVLYDPKRPQTNTLWME